MNPGQLRGLGILLGTVVIVIIVLEFVKLYSRGEPNWYYLVMACGMLLILFYSVRRRRF